MQSLERIGRYRLERRLGTGAFGTVWLAHDDRLEAPVAVKVLAENWSHRLDVRDRFLAEARLLRRADSNRVVQVYDIGELPDGRPYFVMEYADAGTLADLLAAGPLPLPEALRLTALAARGAAALHEAGIVHRDIKPSNVLLRTAPDGTRRVLLADLGLAKNLAQASGLTLAAGSAGYQPPEQAEPGAGIDARADVYSLGAVGYELLTGTVPGAPGRIVRPDRLRPELDEDVVQAVVRALEPDRERRWPSARAFAEELERLAGRRGPAGATAPDHSAHHAAGRPARRPDGTQPSPPPAGPTANGTEQGLPAPPGRRPDNGRQTSPSAADRRAEDPEQQAPAPPGRAAADGRQAPPSPADHPSDGTAAPRGRRSDEAGQGSVAAGGHGPGSDRREPASPTDRGLADAGQEPEASPGRGPDRAGQGPENLPGREPDRARQGTEESPGREPDHAGQGAGAPRRLDGVRRRLGVVTLALAAVLAAGAAAVVVTLVTRDSPAGDVRVADSTGHVTAEVPASWGRQLRDSGWNPRALGLRSGQEPGLAVADDLSKWPDLTTPVNGVFIGLSEHGDVTAEVNSLTHQGCHYTGSHAFTGADWKGRTRTWTDCSGGGSVTETALTPADGASQPQVYVQVREHEGDAGAAATARVLRSLRVT